MKKCVATCIYRSKTMVSFSVNCNGTIVILANKKKEYPSFTELTEACLAVPSRNRNHVAVSAWRQSLAPVLHSTRT